MKALKSLLENTKLELFMCSIFSFVKTKKKKLYFFRTALGSYQNEEEGIDFSHTSPIHTQPSLY